MKARPYLFVIGLLITALACGTGTSTAVPEPTEEADVVTETVVPSEPAATVLPEVTHVMTPGEFPTEPSGVVGDQDCSVTAEEQRAPSGDRFTFSRFERPFNASTMDVYYPSIDIQGATFYQDDLWLYLEVTLKDISGDANGWRYGLELDLDVNGKGDLLVLAGKPASTEWSTAGVEVWEDTNDDVGGVDAALTDKTQVTGDGFETLLFGETFTDPDLAWARVSPANPNAVQIAVKRELLAGDNTFLAGAWAGGEDLNPALFDLNDQFTHEQAGTSVVELPIFYPIKEISELDNTCRMAIGFQPTGSEPGLCPLPIVPGEEPPLPSQSVCPPQYIVCFPTGNQIICICAQP